jgi:hypothetical protein
MEIVRDPNVISAYMKKREEIEFDKIPLDQMVPTGIPEKDAVLYQKCVSLVVCAHIPAQPSPLRQAS